MSNVAVVVLDTVRYDSFEEHFQWLDGIRFPDVYSTSHWTVPAHASLFTGEYASDVGVTSRSPALACDEQTLAEAFQDTGYHTRCLSANAQLNQYEGWDRGFDEFVRTPNLGRTDERILDWEEHIGKTEPGIRRNLSGVVRCLSEDVDTIRSLRYGIDLFRTPRYDGGTKAIRRRIANTDFGDDEFLFCNLMEAHTPYHPPPGETEAATVVVAEALADAVDDPDRLREAYRTSVRYLSREYRKLHAELLESFDYVVTLSDHGELLGEYGLWNHSIGLHPELVRIPAVIAGSDVEPERIGGPISLLDFHKTIADLADVPVDSAGRNLLDEAPERDVLFESHGLLPFHRGQFERYGVPDAEFDRWQTPLFGFVSPDGAYCYEPAPGEFRVVGETDVDDPETRLRELTEDLDNQDPDGDGPEVSEEVKRRLEELGYA